MFARYWGLESWIWWILRVLRTLVDQELRTGGRGRLGTSIRYPRHLSSMLCNSHEYCPVSADPGPCDHQPGGASAAHPLQGVQADQAAEGQPGRQHQDLDHRHGVPGHHQHGGDPLHAGLRLQGQEHPQQTRDQRQTQQGGLGQGVQVLILLTFMVLWQI